MVCTGDARMRPCYVVSAHISESNGILLANEIACVTPRCYRQKQKALMEGAAHPPPPAPQEPVLWERKEGPGLGAESKAAAGPRAHL